MKNVPVDLLAFMSERGPHEYETEKAAMEELTDGIVTNKETLLKYFRKIKYVIIATPGIYAYMNSILVLIIINQEIKVCMIGLL